MAQEQEWLWRGRAKRHVAGAARLNVLNVDKGVRYYAWMSRFCAEGPSGT